MCRKRLADPSPRVRRLAAEALGRIGDRSAVPDLFAAHAAEGNDRPLDHALTYALIEIGDRDAIVVGLTHPSPRVRRAALAALDQMPGGKPDAGPVVAALDDDDAALRETAWWVAGHHPEWGGALAGRFAAQLAAADALAPAGRDELTDRLVQFAGDAAVQAALADAVKSAPAGGRTVALRAMARSGLKALPAGWAAALGDSAAVLWDRRFAFDALAVYRAVPPAAADFERFIAAMPADAADDLRLAVLAARPAGGAVDDAAARFLVERVAKTGPVAARSAAADALARVRLSPPQLVGLAGALKTVGPMELAKLLPAFANKDEAAGRALVAALSDPAVRPMVRAELVKPVLDKAPAAVRAEADKLYALLAEARKDEVARLDKLAASLQPGDVRRGQAVFNGSKAACASCHKIGYVGGLVGPDLTRIGGIRSERDLLEAIAAPSASFVRSYEPVRVVTADGRTFNGILKKDAPGEVVLAVAADQDVIVHRADIEEMVPGTVSVMPSGLDQQLSPGELADLIAFLKACK
jgi:putative heme-binding domain-containing protein